MVLDCLNRFARGWFFRFILALIVLTFVFFGTDTLLFNRSSQDAVVWVNGEAVPPLDYQRIYEHMRVSKPELSEPVLKGLVLDTLIDIRLLAQDALKLGLVVTDPDLLQTLKTMPVFQEKGQFSSAQLDAWLSAMGLDRTRFFELLRSDKRVEAMRYGLARTAFVLPSESAMAEALSKAVRTFDYLILPKKKVASRLNIHEDQLKSYYQAHESEFKTPEHIDLAYLDLSLERIQSTIRPSEAVLKQYYQAHLDRFSQPQSKYLSFDSVRDRIQEAYVTQEAQRQLTSQVERLTQAVIASPYDLDKAAKQLGLLVKTTGFFSRDDQSSVKPEAAFLMAEPEVVQTAFSSDVLEEGLNSTPLSVGQHVVVVRRSQRAKPRTRSFSEVRPLIQARFVEEQSIKEAIDWAKTLIRQADLKKALPSELQWQHVSVKQPKIDPLILEAAYGLPFSNPRLTLNQRKTPQSTVIRLNNGDYAVIWVKAVQLGRSQPKPSPELASQKAYLAYLFYLADLRQKAKIKLNSDFFP